MRSSFLRTTMKLLAVTMVTGVVLMSGTGSRAQILHKKKKVNKSTNPNNNAEPDKILYDKGIDAIKHSRHEVGRLNMQTLINTYPDSEYLAKAKLAIADSFYKEGGSANLTQAVQAYKDFGVFFPFLPEAAYAQLQVAMTHYKQMEKPDRDRTQARAAEEEFQIFLSKYGNDPLAPKAEQHLRDVQEVLAEGDFRIGYFYYVKGDKKAAEARLRTMVNRYPLYSKADRTLWMLGNLWESTEKKEFAAAYYARIVRNYPLSPLAADAKGRLKTLGAPVPQPDPTAVAWMRAEQNAPRPHTSLVRKPMGFFHSGPEQEMQVASQAGKPNMTPESESEAGTDILTGGSQPRIGGGGTGIVATVTPGEGVQGTGGAESVAPTLDGTASATGSQPESNAPAATDASAVTKASDSNATASGDAIPTAKPEASTDPAAQPADAPKTDAAPAQDANQTGVKDDSKKESTSKKKKGLKKLIPW